MAEVPINEKLYAMVVTQAKAKYRVYPSPGASHWVHRRYLELGGKFEDSTEKAYREKLREHAAKVARHKILAHGEDHDDDDRMSKKKRKKNKGESK